MFSFSNKCFIRKIMTDSYINDSILSFNKEELSIISERLKNLKRFTIKNKKKASVLIPLCNINDSNTYKQSNLFYLLTYNNFLLFS